MPALSDFLLGKNQSIQNIPRFTPEQMQFQNTALQNAQENLGTDAIERLARQRFQTSTIPLLSTRFASANAGGTSGYQNALRNEGTNLELGLAALRQQNANQLANIGLTPQYEQVLERAQPAGLGQSLLTGLATTAPQIAELGIRGASQLASYFNKPGQTGQQANQANVPSPLNNVASGIGTAGSILGGLSGLGSTIGSGLASIAPFALPIAGGAAVLALPFILSKLLED